MGEELVFGMVICVGIMFSGGIWGLVLGMRYRGRGGGERDLFGLREVSVPEKENFGGVGRGRRGGVGDLEAGLGAGRGEGERKVRIVRLCVCPKHRDGGDKSGLESKRRGEDNSNLASKSRSTSSGSKAGTHTTSPSSPPIPTTSVQPSPIQAREQAESTEFILPPPTATRRSFMRSRPHSRVYTHNIPLDTLKPDGTRGERRKKKTISLQLKDMPEIESSRDRRTRSIQEVDDDIFIIGEDDDD